MKPTAPTTGRWKSAILALAGAALLALPATHATALEIRGAGSNAGVPLASDGQLQALRNQIQRQQFQQQQQQYRTQDRRVAAPTPPVIEVPRIKPTCQVQVYGNAYMRTCR